MSCLCDGTLLQVLRSCPAVRTARRGSSAAKRYLRSRSSRISKSFGRAQPRQILRGLLAPGTRWGLPSPPALRRGRPVTPIGMSSGHGRWVVRAFLAEDKAKLVLPHVILGVTVLALSRCARPKGCDTRPLGQPCNKVCGVPAMGNRRDRSSLAGGPRSPRFN